MLHLEWQKSKYWIILLPVQPLLQRFSKCDPKYGPLGGGQGLPAALQGVHSVKIIS